MFQVLDKIDFKPSDKETAHKKQRTQRISAYSDLLSNNFIECFVVNTNHANGLEVHCINENGLIYIYNKLSKKLVTILHPRPSQIKRYYRQLGIRYSQTICELAQACYNRNETKHYNNK